MMWQNLRCGLTAGKSTAGRGGLRAMMWQNLRCGLTAGQITAGRATGSDFQPAQDLIKYHTMQHIVWHAVREI